MDLDGRGPVMGPSAGADLGILPGSSSSVPALECDAERRSRPDEFERLQAAERVVRLRWTPPGARKAQELTVLQDQFDAIAEGGDMRSILLQAITAEHERRGRGREQAPSARRRRGRGAERGKVDYATLEHAREPHRGRITEAEKQLVRQHLNEVNRRLEQQGYRTIDPADPEMQKRYGLPETA